MTTMAMTTITRTEYFHKSPQRTGNDGTNVPSCFIINNIMPKNHHPSKLLMIYRGSFLVLFTFHY